MYSVFVASLSLSQLPLEHLDQVQIGRVTVRASLVLWILSRNEAGLSLCVEPVSSLSQCLMLWSSSRHGQAAVVQEPETATQPWHSFSEGSQLHSNETTKGSCLNSPGTSPFLFSCSSTALPVWFLYVLAWLFTHSQPGTRGWGIFAAKSWACWDVI